MNVYLGTFCISETDHDEKKDHDKKKDIQFTYYLFKRKI